MKTWSLLFPALLSFGCSSEPGGAPKESTPPVQPRPGQLSLELLGADRAGHPYRLRHATFRIHADYLFVQVDQDAGDGSQTVSSDTQPDATSIATRVLPGSYSIALEPGWFLEKVTGKAAERVEQSVLLSPSSVYEYVWQDQTTVVTYLFGVDGTLIDFRHGDLSIGFDVEHPGEGDGDGGLAADGG